MEARRSVDRPEPAGGGPGAEALLASFDTDQARTLGFYLLADLALGLVRAQTGQSLDDLVRELTLLVATTPPPPPG
ncbi:hypothetical protein AB0M35_00120 [Micromonospora sp. NPDC051196]|uniref:hypothetical protein n=1 Tax=Micromonospora sp. NPDC051196 TaxID=3155281 RepID=UPI00344682B2